MSAAAAGSSQHAAAAADWKELDVEAFFHITPTAPQQVTKGSGVPTTTTTATRRKLQFSMTSVGSASTTPRESPIASPILPLGKNDDLPTPQPVLLPPTTTTAQHKHQPMMDEKEIQHHPSAAPPTVLPPRPPLGIRPKFSNVEEETPVSIFSSALLSSSPAIAGGGLGEVQANLDPSILPMKKMVEIGKFNSKIAELFRSWLEMRDEIIQIKAKGHARGSAEILPSSLGEEDSSSSDSELPASSSFRGSSRTQVVADTTKNGGANNNKDGDEEVLKRLQAVVTGNTAEDRERRQRNAGLRSLSTLLRMELLRLVKLMLELVNYLVVKARKKERQLQSLCTYLLSRSDQLLRGDILGHSISASHYKHRIASNPQFQLAEQDVCRWVYLQGKRVRGSAEVEALAKLAGEGGKKRSTNLRKKSVTAVDVPGVQAEHRHLKKLLVEISSQFENARYENFIDESLKKARGRESIFSEAIHSNSNSARFTLRVNNSRGSGGGVRDRGLNTQPPESAAAVSARLSQPPPLDEATWHALFLNSKLRLEPLLKLKRSQTKNKGGIKEKNGGKETRSSSSTSSDEDRRSAHTFNDDDVETGEVMQVAHWRTEEKKKKKRRGRKSSPQSRMGRTLSASPNDDKSGGGEDDENSSSDPEMVEGERGSSPSTSEQANRHQANDDEGGDSPPIPLGQAKSSADNLTKSGGSFSSLISQLIEAQKSDSMALKAKVEAQHDIDAAKAEEEVEKENEKRKKNNRLIPTERPPDLLPSYAAGDTAAADDCDSEYEEMGEVMFFSLDHPSSSSPSLKEKVGGRSSKRRSAKSRSPSRKSPKRSRTTNEDDEAASKKTHPRSRHRETSAEKKLRQFREAQELIKKAKEEEEKEVQRRQEKHRAFSHQLAQKKQERMLAERALREAALEEGKKKEATRKQQEEDKHAADLRPPLRPQTARNRPSMSSVGHPQEKGTSSTTTTIEDTPAEDALTLQEESPTTTSSGTTKPGTTKVFSSKRPQTAAPSRGGSKKSPAKPPVPAPPKQPPQSTFNTMHRSQQQARKEEKRRKEIERQEALLAEERRAAHERRCDAAIRRIVSWIRACYEREAERLEKEALERLQDAAARRLQRTLRGYLARCALWRFKIESAAVLKIQVKFREFSARRKLQSRKERIKSEVVDKLIQNDKDFCRRILRGMRLYYAKQVLKNMKYDHYQKTMDRVTVERTNEEAMVLALEEQLHGHVQDLAVKDAMAKRQAEIDEELRKKEEAETAAREAREKLIYDSASKIAATVKMFLARFELPSRKAQASFKQLFSLQNDQLENQRKQTELEERRRKNFESLLQGSRSNTAASSNDELHHYSSQIQQQQPRQEGQPMLFLPGDLMADAEDEE